MNLNKGRWWICMFFLFSLTLVSSLPSDSDVDITFTYPINYSEVPTVNNSQYFDGYSVSSLWTYYSGLGNALWCQLTGCTMAGDIDMNGNNINNIGTLGADLTDLDDVSNGQLDDYVLAWNDTANMWMPKSLETIYYNATSYSAVTGTPSGTISLTQHPNGDYDDITLNFTEQVSAPALDVRINFTDGIESFTQGIMRYKTSSLAGDYPTIYLWDYEDGEWESYGTLLETPIFETISQPVYDSSSHVQNGTVQMRLYKAGTGNINNEYYIDWLAIAKGFGIPASNEVDPFAWHKDGSSEASGNWNISPYNITADYFFGDGSQLTGIEHTTQYWNKTGSKLSPATSGDKLKMVSPMQTIPNIAGSLNLDYFDASTDSYFSADSGDIEWKVWGYKDYGVKRLWTSNFLYDAIDGSSSPYTYIGTYINMSGGNIGYYDGFLIEYYDDEGFYTEYGIGTDTVAYFDDDMYFYPPYSSSTDVRDYTVEVYQESTMIETNGITGEDGTGDILFNTTIIGTGNNEFYGNDTFKNITVTDLVVGQSFTAGKANFDAAASFIANTIGIGKDKIYFPTTGYNLGLSLPDYGFRFTVPSASYNFGADGMNIIGSTGTTMWFFESDSGSESWSRFTELTMGATAGVSDLLGASAELLNLYGNLYLIRDNDAILFGADKDANITWDGTNLNFDTGTGIAYFSGNLSAENVIDRTYITNATNKEAYELVQYATKNFYKDGVKNYSAWGECYAPMLVTDMDRPVIITHNYTEEIEVNGTFKNKTFYYNTTDYPFKKTQEGVDMGCKQVMTQKAQSYMEEEFDGNVAYFNEIYTKSKVPEIDINYCQMIAEADIYNKSNHYAYKELNGRFVLDAEYRWVVLEGCEKQKLAEMCAIDKHYSWCDK